MIKAGDFKVCLSSIEFSIFYQESTPKCCPSCGQFFPPETLSEVTSRYFRESYFRLSSLILVLGVGSWLCYKMIIKKRSKMKPKKSMPSSCSTITPHDQMIINRMDKLFKFRSNSPHSSSKKATAAAAAAAAAAAVYNNLNHQFNHPKETLTHDSHGLPTTEEVSYTVSYSDSETDYVDLEDEEDDYYIKETDVLSKALDQYSTMKRSYSISSQSGEIGEGTIAKLDQLLHQIEDIKESVGKMNSDFFTVHSYDHNRLLTAADINDEDGDGPLSNYFEHSGQDSHVPTALEYLGDKEEPQTPSLEWDSNDINLFSEVNEGYQSNETEIAKTSLVKVSAIKQIATSLSSTNQNNKSSSSTISSENSNNHNSSFKSFGPGLVSPVISESINSFPTSSSYRNLANLDTSFTTGGIISSSGVTSIDGSLLSSPDQERVRFESIHDLIKEARRLGLLNDLVKFLLKNANRDSAYFED